MRQRKKPCQLKSNNCPKVTFHERTDSGGAPGKGAPPIYFDEAASALPHPMLSVWFDQLCREYPYNPHGGTKYGELSKRRIMAAEDCIRQILGAENANVIWTSGVTEALNLAIHSIGGVSLKTGSHPAMMEPAGRQQGQRHPSNFAASHIESETGSICDLNALRKEFGDGLLLVDGAQSFCKIDIPWRSAAIDLLAISSRKIGGPGSIGALIVKKGIEISPLMFGGGQQNGLRPGTLDVVGIALFAEVARDRALHQEENYRKVSELNRILFGALNESGLRFKRISPENAYPGIVTLAFPGYEGALISRILADREGILLSAGSACTAETGKPSKTLIAAAGSEQLARSSIRISLSHYNTEPEILRLTAAIKRCLENY